MTRGGVNSPVAPVDLSQSIIGPGMGIFSKYTAVLERLSRYVVGQNKSFLGFVAALTHGSSSWCYPKEVGRTDKTGEKTSVDILSGMSVFNKVGWWFVRILSVFFRTCPYIPGLVRVCPIISGLVRISPFPRHSYALLCQGPWCHVRKFCFLPANAAIPGSAARPWAVEFNRFAVATLLSG